MSQADEFLMRSGAKSAAFPAVGATVKGVIAREPDLQQQRDFDTQKPAYWDDGAPKQQIRVILATSERDDEDDEDNGERALYLKGNMLKAVQKAVREAGAKGLQVGGKLALKYVKDGDQPKKGLAKPKLYVAKYEKPDALAQVANAEAKAEAPAAQAEPEDDGDDLKF